MIDISVVKAALLSLRSSNKNMYIVLMIHIIRDFVNNVGMLSL